MFRFLSIWSKCKVNIFFFPWSQQKKRSQINMYQNVQSKLGLIWKSWSWCTNWKRKYLKILKINSDQFKEQIHEGDKALIYEFNLSNVYFKLFTWIEFMIMICKSEIILSASIFLYLFVCLFWDNWTFSCAVLLNCLLLKVWNPLF